MVFYYINDAAVIEQIFKVAGYTYGPLLGLYAFGLFTKINVKDFWVPIVAILTPFIGYAISYYCSTYLNFDFGFFILILNGAITFLGLVLIRAK